MTDGEPPELTRQKALEGIMMGTLQYTIKKVYGEKHLELYEDYRREHPNLSPNQLWQYFQEHAVNTQTDLFRERNLKGIATNISEILKNEGKTHINILELACSSGAETF